MFRCFNLISLKKEPNNAVWCQNGMRVFYSIAAGALTAAIACAQPSGARLEFDAASVKRNRPDAPKPSGNSCKGGPGTSDPGLFTCSGAALSLLVSRAYKLQFYELIAPEWMNHGGIDGYDIVARLPPSATDEEFREMLQALLAERFLLAVHWDQKVYPQYALRVAKTGLKIKPAQAPNTAVEPKFSMSFVNGSLRLNFVKKPLSELADVLTTLITGPVADETALGQSYDFTLEFMPDERWRGFPSMPKPADAATANAPPLEAALKEQLGLLLEKRDAPLRVLVVDKVQKSPVEN